MPRRVAAWIRKWFAKAIGATVSTAVVAVLAAGCAQQPAAATDAVEDRAYAVTPAAIKVKAGIITGDVTELKITERVEKGSDRVVSPAKLTGTVTLKNASADQTVRLIAGKIQYIDAQGQPIKLEAARTEPALKFAAYGNERLDPGQEATQSLEVEFPAEALKAKRLKEIRLDLAYIPTPYREETVRLAVSIGLPMAPAK